MSTELASFKAEDAAMSTSSGEKNSSNESRDGVLTSMPEAPPRNMGKIQWALTVAAVYSATLLYGLDTTIVADIQVSILERFGHIDQLTWIGAGFPLGSVAVILPIGVLYGLFNIKYLYIISFVLFEGGSALCGAAPNMNALIVGRVIAGIGGSGMYLG